MSVIEKIKDVLGNRSPIPIENSDQEYIHAAVLIPLFREPDGYRVLFTQRTNRVEHHKGQISFPGGVVEEIDNSLEETALRESHEEIGLLDRDVEILGQMDDTYTVASKFIVHPFVGRIPYPYDFKINPREVNRIITVPLDFFFKIDAYQTIDLSGIDDPTYVGPVYPYQDAIIWGATARIMENFVEAMGGKLGLPERVE